MTAERFIRAVVTRALRIAALEQRRTLSSVETVELDELRRSLVRPPAGSRDPRYPTRNALEIIRRRRRRK